MVKKEISSVKNWKEAFWETALLSVNSSHRVTAFPSKCLSLRLFLWNLQSDIWNPQRAVVKKEISSVKNWKEAFWEIALCSLNSSHRVTAFPSRSLSLRLLLWNWKRDILKPIEEYGKKALSSVKNWKEAFWETALCSVNSSHSITAFPSRRLSQRLFLWNSQSDIWKPTEGYGDKGNIFS